MYCLSVSMYFASVQAHTYTVAYLACMLTGNQGIMLVHTVPCMYTGIAGCMHTVPLLL